MNDLVIMVVIFTQYFGIKILTFIGTLVTDTYNIQYEVGCNDYSKICI